LRFALVSGLLEPLAFVVSILALLAGLFYWNAEHQRKVAEEQRAEAQEQKAEAEKLRTEAQEQGKQADYILEAATRIINFS
jgi:CHASE3 domain sensor protein